MMFKKGSKSGLLRFIVLYAVCCLPIQAGAKEQADSAASSDWTVLPIIASTTETGLQLGVLTIYFFPQEQEKSPPSRLTFAALATQNEQYLASLSPEFYFWDGRYHLDSAFRLRDWPSNYYGIGNDTPDEADEFNADGREIKIELARRIRHRYALGLRYRFSSEDITSNPDGLLARDNPPGISGGDVNGLGLTASYDTRDNVNDARSGSFVYYSATAYRESLGSDFDYDEHLVDLRRYLVLTSQTGLAFAGHLRSVSRSTPFWDLSTPDGDERLRGIERGRYRDRDLLSLQAEYRWSFHNRFGMTSFLEAAQVQPAFREMRASEFRYSLGLGLRYAIVPKQQFNIRADFALVDDSFGMVINVGEAF